MEGEFNKCLNGHWYQGENCPYCKTSNNGDTFKKTEVYVHSSGENDQPTETPDGGNRETKTAVVGKQKTVVGGAGVGNAVPPQNRTVIEETEIIETQIGKVEKKTYRSSRKLVGWLVTYSHDVMGEDFKIKEGKNTIGHDKCNITVTDPVMSGKHATILFQDNIYFLKDELSTHGTFVNDVKMRPDSSQEIKDGDIIKMGKTKFKFRTSL